MDERNATITVNGVVFSRDKQGFLPRLMKKMYTDRSAYKKKMIKAKQAYEKSHSFDDLKLVAQLNNLQMSKKIQLNSGYGALANVYFRWFDPRIAEAITTCGQLSTRWVEKAVNQKLNEFLQTEGVDYIIAADTDSMYLNLGPVVDKLWPECTVQEQVEHVDRFTKNYVQTWIDEAVEALTKYVNAYALEMRMKREAIANKGIWSAKKRYVLNMYDLEGVRFEEPKLKIMGSEAIRSSTPTAVRQQIKDTFALIMNTDEKTVQQSIKEFRKKFKELPFEDIAFPRGCNGIAKWTDIDGTYRSSCPIHVKGAIMYNKLLRDRGLDKTLSPIMEGEKIKFIYMKTPNPLQVAVLSVPGNLPRQLNLEQYVDYDTQFEKAFLEPISGVLGKIGWRAEKLNTLTQFIQ
jgi:DNA polymerase elongation subunit (family B)